jgi:hypothetical protein
MPREPKEPKHHYIPVFYLKQWAGGDGRLCEFSKPYDRIKPRRVHPDGTGYVRGLNTVEGLPPTESRFLEDVFFQFADDGAARVLQTFMQPPPWTLTAKERSAWSRFIMALMVRNPESLEKYKNVAAAIFQEARSNIEALYAKERKPSDPPTYAEYSERHGPYPLGRTIVRVVQTLADNEALGRNINSMRWTVLSNPEPKFELLTSDRPMLVTNGIGPPNGELLIPISPFHLFVATNNIETEMKVRAVWKNGHAMAAVNDRIASQARKYVYGKDDKQLLFVSKRLGRKYPADPTENLSFETLLAGARAGMSRASEHD